MIAPFTLRQEEIVCSGGGARWKALFSIFLKQQHAENAVKHGEKESKNQKRFRASENAKYSSLSPTIIGTKLSELVDHT